MTLLEALLALVILGVSVVGYLDVFQVSARSVREAAEWTRVVAAAESAMEGATLGDGLQAQQGVGGEREGADALVRTVEVRRWREPNVSEIVVTVTSARGTTFTLRRLARMGRR